MSLTAPTTTLDRFPLDVVRDLAMSNGVCVRPVLNRVFDTQTGTDRVVGVSCGSTLVSKCPPCAAANRRLRMQQCREGWHRDTEPDDLVDDELPADETEEDKDTTRRTRSTRRRQDAADLPKVEMDKRTVGATFTAPNGKTYRPSMFITLTLGSYGATHRLPHRVPGKGLVPCECGVIHGQNSPLLSTPVDPNTYDYRRAALDALHFPKLIDRFIQNLRRCAGYKAQYFAVVEPQKRLAPHLHAAVRGTVARDTVREVAKATYHQVWWPSHQRPVYGCASNTDLPVWDEMAGAFVDPSTGALLPTWDQALDDVDADPAARPAHVVRFGTQIDYQGIVDSEAKVGKAIGYLTKYLGKSIGETYGDDPEALHTAQLAHINKLHAHVRVLPCSPECANWLRYGVTPKGATGHTVPGECPSKAHDREHLGLGGRRVLVSRQWTGKTLTEHRADRSEVIRQTLAAAGVEMDDQNALATHNDDTEAPRFIWQPIRPGEALGPRRTPTHKEVMAEAIATRIRWRTQYEQAKQRANPPGAPPDDTNSATDTAASAA